MPDHRKNLSIPVLQDLRRMVFSAIHLAMEASMELVQSAGLIARVACTIWVLLARNSLMVEVLDEVFILVHQAMN